jgi:hypothetical protein
MGPLEITEWLLRQPPPWSRGLVVNMPARGMTIDGRLFQAGMWRQYAGAFRGLPTSTGVGKRWLENVAHKTREECVRRARVNLYLARRLRRRAR